MSNINGVFPQEIQSLNIEDLDVQELENRLEMSMLEAPEAGWVEICTDKCSCLNDPKLPPCPIDNNPN